jgi:hypothetical protein
MVVEVNTWSDPVPLSTTGVVQTPCYGMFVLNTAESQSTIPNSRRSLFSALLCFVLHHGRLFALGTKFRTMANTVFNIITAILPLHIKMCISSRAPSSSKGHRSLQNCGSSVCNLLHITRLAPGICRPLCFRHQYEIPR